MPWQSDDPALAVPRRLRLEVADCEVVEVRLPGQPPCDLADGLDWLAAMAAEGWYTDYSVERDGSSAVVWVKSWEYGDPEPEWASVRSTPVQPSPDAEAWASDAAYQRSREEARSSIMRATADQE